MAIARDPDELAPFVERLSLAGPVEPFLVFADWLQEKGDPWGELIAVQCAMTGATSDQLVRLIHAEQRLLSAHGEDLCFLHRRRRVSVEWRRGFVDRIVIESGADVAPFDDLPRLFSLRCATSLFARLVMRECHLDDMFGRTLLAWGPRLAKLDELDLEGNTFSRSMVGKLEAAFPRARLGDQRGQMEDRRLTRAEAAIREAEDDDPRDR